MWQAILSGAYVSLCISKTAYHNCIVFWVLIIIFMIHHNWTSILFNFLILKESLLCIILCRGPMLLVWVTLQWCILHLVWQQAQNIIYALLPEFNQSSVTLHLSTFNLYNCPCFFQYYPLEEVLAAEYMLEDFRPDLIEMVLDKLRPENVRSVKDIYSVYI